MHGYRVRNDKFMQANAAPKTIDDYIERFPADVRVKLRAIRNKVKTVAPNAVEKISYGIPTFSMGRNIFHFAAYKTHVGLYPGPAALTACAAALKAYKTSKGTLRIPLGQQPPLSLIGDLVRFNLKRLDPKPAAPAIKRR